MCLVSIDIDRDMENDETSYITYCRENVTQLLIKAIQERERESNTGLKAMAEQGGGGPDHGITTQDSQDTEWSIDIKERIMKQAGDVVPCDSEQLRRLDALFDIIYPSIFRPRENAKGVTVAAIGPYHRSKPCQNNAQHQSQTQPGQPIITDGKKSLIVRFFANHRSLDIGQFLDWVRNHERRVRLYYEQPFSMEIAVLAKMLLLDGCLVLFAIFLLRSSVNEDKKPVQMALDRNYGKEFTKVAEDISLSMRQLKFDLLRLDNQIPFFVIEKLYSMLRTTLFDGIPHGIKQMALSCFDDIQPRRGRRGESSEPPIAVHHLLHLFHWSLIPSRKYGLDIESFHLKEPKAHLPSATELWESSATIFRRSPPGSSLDVSFHRTICMRGAISIPASYICDYSESIFRNLIAFEQKHIRCSLSVTAYCICMARLLQSEDDAKLLRKNRILAHTEKSDKEIVDFFRSLSDEYSDTLLPKDFLRLYKNVQTYHDNWLGRTWGGVTLHYCPNPYIIISLFFGALLFMFTIAYHTHNWIRYYHPIVKH